MIKIFQTDTSPETGNCFAACVASILELDSIPDFKKIEDRDQWNEQIEKFLEPFGLWLHEFYCDNPDGFERIPGYSIQCGPVDDGVFHSVVAFDGKLVHDPFPGGDGINWVSTAGVFVMKDPAKIAKGD